MARHGQAIKDEARRCYTGYVLEFLSPQAKREFNAGVKDLRDMTVRMDFLAWTPVAVQLREGGWWR